PKTRAPAISSAAAGCCIARDPAGGRAGDAVLESSRLRAAHALPDLWAPFECSNCTAWLVEHRFVRELQCHHCGHLEKMPEFCPACGAAGTLAACGPGVERLAEEVSARFPAARLAVVASDTLAGPRAVAELVHGVEGHTIDVLIGT